MTGILHFIIRRRAALTTVALAMLLSVSALYFSDRDYVVRGVEFTTSARPSLSGHTVLELPPLGRIGAQTHRVPIAIVLSLKHVDVVELEGVFAGDKVRDELFADLVAGAKAAGRDFALRLLLIATILGAGAGLLAGARSRRYILLGSGTALIFTGALIGATAATFDIGAFSQPQFTGTLRAAPAIVGAVRKSVHTFEGYRSEVRRMAANLSSLYIKMDNLDSMRPPTVIEGNQRLVTVMHVSDVHNNVAAFDFIKRIASTFPVDFIVDSGDLTDFGTGPEVDLLQQIRSVPLPYLWTAGNHDSPAVVQALRGMKNVTVLDGGVTRDNLRIFGYPDPQAQRPLVLAPDAAANRRQADAISAAFAGSSGTPDVLVVHNPDLARKILGKAPVILTGHTHKAGVVKTKGSWILNAGTTGGAGLRTLKTEDGLPLSLQLLYFDPETAKLVAVDSISLLGTKREFTMRRQFLIDQPRRSESASSGALLEIGQLPRRPDSRP